MFLEKLLRVVVLFKIWTSFIYTFINIQNSIIICGIQSQNFVLFVVVVFFWGGGRVLTMATFILSNNTIKTVIVLQFKCIPV